MPDTFIVTNRAKRDIKSIWQYIAAENVKAADDVETAIYEAFDALCSFPNAGHQRRDLTHRPLRFWTVHPHKNYLIIYNPKSQPVRIIRVLHRALDLSEILR